MALFAFKGDFEHAFEVDFHQLGIRYSVPFMVERLKIANSRQPPPTLKVEPATMLPLVRAKAQQELFRAFEDKAAESGDVEWQEQLLRARLFTFVGTGRHIDNHKFFSQSDISNYLRYMKKKNRSGDESWARFHDTIFQMGQDVSGQLDSKTRTVTMSLNRQDFPLEVETNKDIEELVLSTFSNLCKEWENNPQKIPKNPSDQRKQFGRWLAKQGLKIEDAVAVTVTCYHDYINWSREVHAAILQTFSQENILTPEEQRLYQWLFIGPSNPEELTDVPMGLAPHGWSALLELPKAVVASWFNHQMGQPSEHSELEIAQWFHGYALFATFALVEIRQADRERKNEEGVDFTGEDISEQQEYLPSGTVPPPGPTNPSEDSPWIDMASVEESVFCEMASKHFSDLGVGRVSQQQIQVLLALLRHDNNANAAEEVGISANQVRAIRSRLRKRFSDVDTLSHLRDFL